MPSIIQNGSTCSDVHEPYGVESRTPIKGHSECPGVKLFEAVGFYNILIAKSLPKFSQYYENVRQAI